MDLKSLASRSALLMCSGLLASCAGTPPPPAELAVANSTVQQAEQVGAVQYAPVELNNARAKIALANNAVKGDHPKEAQRLAAEAAADAKLAEAKAQAVQAQQAAAAGRAPTPPLAPAPVVPTAPAPVQ